MAGSTMPAVLLRGGRVLAQHRKACLPNYKVFDEKRYFAGGHSADASWTSTACGSGC